MSKARYLAKFHYVRDFLSPEFNRTLLDSLLADPASFEDAMVYSNDGQPSRVDRENRLAQEISVPSDLQKRFVNEIGAILPDVMPKVGLEMRDNFRFELTAAVHQDGGFFRRHIDTHVAADQESDRYLSAVYYMSKTPQQFSGGQFRLHAIVGGGHQDFEARNNTLMMFPSFAPHEVLPISVPSGRVEDGRFSVNCWVRVPRTSA